MTNEQTIDEIMACADWYRAIDYVKWPESRGKLRNMITAALAAKDAEIERLKARLTDSGCDLQALKASPAPGEWIEWRGGRSPPIPDGILHQARLRNGAELNENSRASAVAWDHQRSARDIIAYRIIS